VDDLIAFLRARLGEDEAAAKAAAERTPSPWVGAFKQVTSEPSGAGIRVVASAENSGISHHIERWDPARVLRDAAFKRLLLDLHEPDQYGCQRCEEPGPACRTLWELAAVYSDHPDYRQEWAP